MKNNNVRVCCEWMSKNQDSTEVIYFSATKSCFIYQVIPQMMILVCPNCGTGLQFNNIEIDGMGLLSNGKVTKD